MIPPKAGPRLKNIEDEKDLLESHSLPNLRRSASPAKDYDSLPGLSPSDKRAMVLLIALCANL
jgi:hypothetical protein